jgi:hypothetical protein
VLIAQCSSRRIGSSANSFTINYNIIAFNCID